MIGRLQRPAEIVHGEDVFQELGLLEIADAAGLARGVELVRHGVGAGVEVVVVERFVDAHAPEDDGGMIPIAADHAAHVVDGDGLARLDRRCAASRGFLPGPAARFRRRHPGNGAIAGSARCARCCSEILAKDVARPGAARGRAWPGRQTETSDGGRGRAA